MSGKQYIHRDIMNLNSIEMSFATHIPFKCKKHASFTALWWVVLCYVSCCLFVRTNCDTTAHCSGTNYGSSKVFEYYFHDCRLKHLDGRFRGSVEILNAQNFLARYQPQRRLMRFGFLPLFPTKPFGKTKIFNTPHTNGSRFAP